MRHRACAHRRRLCGASGQVPCRGNLRCRRDAVRQDRRRAGESARRPHLVRRAAGERCRHLDICTPPALHVPQALAALAAGKHVVCEKPLAGSLAEVDRLIEAEGNARAADADLPVPLRRRVAAGQAHHDRARRQALSARSRPPGGARPPITHALARPLETELGGVAHHPGDPFARPDDLADGTGRIGVRRDCDARQPDRGRGLRGREPSAARRRARLARCDARLAQGDQPPALLLRARDVRERPGAVQPGRRSVEDHPGIGCGRRADRPGLARLDSSFPRASTG